MTRYIFITGGVVSSLGKGITAASLGSLLQAYGFSIKIRKIDPYLNIDPGTISPYQHGEVFVTKDGKETDLDLGHYERFTDLELRAEDSITSGKIYNELLQKERRGDYLGKTVQVIPHVTDLVKKVISRNTEDIDFLICEVGGTIGDMEGLPYYETIRQLKYTLGDDRVISIHLTLLPYIAASQELKTKPTQHSVRELRSLGVQPDILVCRAERTISKDCLAKISLLTGIKEEFVIPLQDQSDIYEVPIVLHEAGLDKQVLAKFKVDNQKKPNLDSWYHVVKKIVQTKDSVTIGLIGKYNDLEDSYSSLLEALKHGGIANGCKVAIKWVDAEQNNGDSLAVQLKGVHAIIIPGGFGARGVEGKIAAAQYARKLNIPFLGICYGMQLAAISLARDLLGLKNANTTEVTQDCTNIIGLLTEWQKDATIERRSGKIEYGGTMRLGDYTCNLKKGSLIHSIYQRDEIEERHRHRYEFNSNYRKDFEEAGVLISGSSIDNKLVEIIELPKHPWFLGVQFHPEFTSRPLKPHPLFVSFVRAALRRKRGS